MSRRLRASAPLRLCVKILRPLALLLVCHLALASVAPAPPPTAAPPPAPNLHQWGAVTLFHGLPSDRVRAVAQDAEGTLWFGTDGGLARFDGRRTQTVVAGAVRALVLDRLGALWVGTESGAGLIAGGAFTPLEGTEGHDVTAVAATAGGQVVLATATGRLFVVSDGVESMGPDTSPLLEGPDGPLPLTSLAAEGERVLVGTRGRGVLALEGGQLNEVAMRPRPYFVEALALDPRAGLWLGTQAKGEEGGLFLAADQARPRLATAATGTVTALCGDGTGDLWVGTNGRGAIRVRDGREVERVTFEGSAGGLRSNHVLAVFVDREGVVWFGTDRGVCRFDPLSPRVDTIGEEKESGFVRSIFVDVAGRAWCGTNRGLFVDAANGDGWRAVEDVGPHAIYAIADAGGGRLVAGTSGGLYALAADGSAAVVGEEKESVRAAQSFRGALYVARFGRGLERLDGDRLVPVWPPDGADSKWRDVVSLSADGDGALWIGTAGAGAFAFDGASAEAGPLEPLASDVVWGVDRGPDGALWVATGRGLVVVDERGADLVVDGVAARAVVAGDTPGTAWCATDGSGVWAVARATPDGPVRSRLDTEHGLPSDRAFALCAGARQGGGPILWIGTNRGVARYGPGATRPGLRVVRAVGARAYEPAEVLAGLALEYPQESLVVDLAAASSRTFPEQVQYAFAITDEAGRMVARRVAHDAQLVLEDLRPGRYRVEARAYTNDLVASEPLSFGFEVERPPFPWGIATLSALLGVALAALWWGAWQNRRLAGANRQIAETRAALANETEAERRRISRDLHDQTLADLRHLMITADAAGGVDPAELRAEIEGISNEIRRICEDLSPSALANVGLTAALEWALASAVAHMPEGRKFEYDFACEDDLEDRLKFHPTEQIQIYRIVQETISNVCRHAGAGRVRLAVAIDDGGDFVVEVEDDGRGFDPKERGLRSGRGLGNIATRAGMIGATVAWAPREGGGTVFTLRVSQ